MNDEVWILNTSDTPYEQCSTELKRWVMFEPHKCVPLPKYIAMWFIQLNSALIILNEEQKKKYMSNGYKWIINRWQGIGDIILLEPIIRKTYEMNQCAHITLRTYFEDVLLGAPYIKDFIHVEGREESKNLPRGADYEKITYLTDYSELAESKNTKHRTDVLNEQFGIDMTDAEKEPCLYLSDDEKGMFKRKRGKIYIGIQCDASSDIRSIRNCAEIIRKLIAADDRIAPVIFGHRETIDIKDDRVINLQGKTTVRQAMCTIRDLDAMIAGDSGLMHVALALHIPTVCIFGMITPALRIQYYTGPRVVIAAPCAGCGDYSYPDDCKKEKVCQTPDVKNIINAVKQFINTKKEPITIAAVIPHHDQKEHLAELIDSMPKNVKPYVMKGGTFATNCNNGAAQAKADGYEKILFVNDDVILNSDCVNEMIELSDTFDVVGAKCMYPDGKAENLGCEIQYFPKEWYKWRAEQRTTPGEWLTVSGACFIMDVQAFEDCGAFNIAYKNSCEDTELFLTALEKGYTFAQTNRSVIHHGSQSTGRFDCDKDNFKLLHERFPLERIQKIITKVKR